MTFASNPVQPINPANAIDPGSLLNSLGDAVIAIAGDNRIRFVNHAAEQLLGAGAPLLNGQSLDNLISGDAPLLAIVEQCRRTGSSVTESEVHLESPRIGTHDVDVRATCWSEDASVVILTLQQRSIARQIDRHMTQRGAARSVSAMAAMLAHEVKNPLSGIRGAAQLLEEEVSDDSQQLTQLICEETDRIVALVNRMDSFSDDRPPERTAVNIHEILDHVRRLAETGFARHLTIAEIYDPSLPPVYGSRDQLVQVFLNLIKNAAEAAPETGGEIQLATRYRHGTRLAVTGGKEHVDLPLEITVRDNGAGIPDDLKSCLFDPFVTTKQNGTGLGLALVAKIIDDHGGMIDVETVPRRTEFRVLLPMPPRATNTRGTGK
ncbi:MAG: PAS domain-containing protein [Alphaproteobacteria bacterium]|nr:PAS domain-containing protein [Alphaproteobacteria bacterium]